MIVFAILLRSLVMFAAVFVVFRILGQRMMAQLTPMDRVGAIAYGTIAGSTAITSSIPLYAGLVAVFAFAILAWALGRVSTSSNRLHHWLVGRPRPLVVRGQVNTTQFIWLTSRPTESWDC